jgi:hypothetical protein
MQYSFDIQGALLSRRITFPFPDQLSIEAAMAQTVKAGLYSSIMKQIEIYKRMDDDGTMNEWPVSMLGTPVFSDVILSSESDNALSIKLENALVVIEQNKKIGRTHVQGRNGSVKEYYANDDYNIEITGSISHENPTAYPMDDVRKLLAIVNLPESVKLSGPFFELFEIFNGVVHHYKLDQKAGVQNQQFFVIKMYSDLPAEIEEAN